MASAADWSRLLHAPSAGALYVHVPFCARKCRYCDFPSWGGALAADPALAGRYADSVATWLDRLASVGLLDGVRTAYVGGGTPSLLGAAATSRLCSAIAAHCDPVELSVEANPDSLGDDVVAALADGGATRVSVGVQSFRDEELAALGRVHDAACAEAAVARAVRAGLDVSCDLMCGIPLQTRRTWRRSVETACELGVVHASVYPLAIEPSTPFGRAVDRGEMAEPDGELQADMMEDARELLTAAGLSRYEVASYAREGHRCAHNVAYWTGVPYAGVGPGASGMLTREGYGRLREVAPQLPAAPADAVRCRVRAKAGSFALEAPERTFFLVEFLDERQAVCEDLMLGARTTDGVSPALAALAREVVGEHEFGATVDGLVRDGLVILRADGSVAPAERGWLMGNELYERFWDLSVGTIETQEC